MTRIIQEIAEWQSARRELAARNVSIGFVPTMGALHDGHRSLLERARAENDVVVLSVFVNPTQFNDPRDLEAYPRDLAADIQFAGPLTDLVFAPTAEALYPDGYHYRVTEKTESAGLEGAHRPGHFDGVLTVVLKLLGLVQPRRAYFGEKDWQQLRLVRGMAAAFFLPVEIVACPTIREHDGLAMSSRNRRLDADDRGRAPGFARILATSTTADAAAYALRREGFEVDYVVDREGVRLGAVKLGGVRLIDNVRL